MKKFYIIFSCLVFITGCKSFYNFTFKNENTYAEKMELDFWAVESLCFGNNIYENNNNYNIENIEYIDGWIKIGHETITFKREEIRIAVVLRGHPKYSMVSIEENGKGIIPEEKKQEYFDYTYMVRFFKELDYKSQKAIYKQNSEHAIAFFEYNVILEDAVVHTIINEEFIFEAEKQLKIAAFIEYITGHL